MTHIEANIVGGYVFCSRHRSTNSCGCVTSPLNLNKWRCSHLDHCLFRIWRRSPIETLSSRLPWQRDVIWEGSTALPEPEAAFSSDDSTKPNHRHSTSGDRAETTQQRGCLCVCVCVAQRLSRQTIACCRQLIFFCVCPFSPGNATKL